MDFDGIKSYKIVMLGEGAVGKTSLMLRYTKNEFIDKHISTIQAAFATKQIETGNNVRCELAIWDTAGQERFHSLGPIYYRDSNGALLVYDITDRKSFERVKGWVTELRQMLGHSVVLFIVGNKIDLESTRNISKDEASRYAESIEAQYYECSAKTDVGVEEIFDKIAQAMLEKSENVINGEEVNEDLGQNGFRRRSGSRRSIRIVEDEPVPERRRRCC